MPLTKSQIIKSYGGRPNFLASFGLKMTPEDIEEGNRILEAFIAGDEEEEAEREAQKGQSGTPNSFGNQQTGSNQSNRKQREVRIAAKNPYGSMTAALGN